MRAARLINLAIKVNRTNPPGGSPIQPVTIGIGKYKFKESKRREIREWLVDLISSWKHPRHMMTDFSIKFPAEFAEILSKGGSDSTKVKAVTENYYIIENFPDVFSPDLDRGR